MTKEEKIIATAFTGIMFIDGSDMGLLYEYMEKKVGHGVIDLTLASKKFWEELHKACEQDFIDMISKEQPSLSSNLDEAAEDFVWEVMENDEDGISDLCRKLRPSSKISDFYDALAEFFKAGAKWMAKQHANDVAEAIESAFNAGKEWVAGQGVQDSIEGTICGRVYDHVNVKFPDGIGETLEPKSVSHIPANVKNYNIGDEVIIQIRKK